MNTKEAQRKLEEGFEAHDLARLSNRKLELEAGITAFLEAYDSYPPDHLDESDLAGAVRDLRDLMATT